MKLETFPTFRRLALAAMTAIAALWLAPPTAHAQSPSSGLPAPVGAALRQAGVPVDAVSVWALRIGSRHPLLQVNASRAMNPASTIKLVTTWAALNLLGPEYRWETRLYADGPREGSTLRGNLYVQGSGDPKLVPEELEKVLLRLRALGIERIDGDLILDTSAFASGIDNAEALDGETRRAYNVAPHALLYAFKTLTFRIAPSPSAPGMAQVVTAAEPADPADASMRLARHWDNGAARVTVTPPSDRLLLENRLRLSDGPCNDWRSGVSLALDETPSSSVAVAVSGVYPASCGEKIINIAALRHDTFFRNGFVALWEMLGGSFTHPPAVRSGRVPATATLLAAHQGAPLVDSVRDINKFSNNVMARQMFLTLARRDDSRGSNRPDNRNDSRADIRTAKAPADTTDAARVVSEWLASQSLPMPELVMENGSGLSRRERIAAANLGRLLEQAVFSPLATTFAASLPLAGVDGTMQKRLLERGIGNEARLKTGSLNDVRAIAGYVQNRAGDVYVLVSLINHPRAPQAQAVHDALVQWLFEQNPPVAGERN